MQLTMSATHDCVFKNGCSMLRPTLLLELTPSPSNKFPNYTAFKIGDRYFNITDIRSVRDNLFEISGEVDVLATYKANILATYAYTIYDSVPNTELVDNRLPMVTTKTAEASKTTCPFVPDGGTYILSLTGSNNTTGVYKVSSNDLAALIDDIQDVKDNIFDFSGNPEPSVPSWSSTSVSENLSLLGEYLIDIIKWAFKNAVLPISQIFGSGNIPENIRECRFIPFDVGTTTEAIPIYLGTFKTKQSFGKLNTETVHRTASVSIPWQTTDYRRRSPFTEIYLYLPYIGMVKLSSENLIDESSLSVAYTLALRDGSLICTVKSGSGSEVLGQYSGNVGASVPVGVSNINLPKAASSLISGIANTATQNLGGIGLAAIQFTDSITPNFSCIGGLDGIAGIATDQNITCYTVFHDTIVPPNAGLITIGSPAMKPQLLGNLTNFVQTLSASVDGAMTSTEREKLNRLLDSGIFIE